MFLYFSLLFILSGLCCTFVSPSFRFHRLLDEEYILLSRNSRSSIFCTLVHGSPPVLSALPFTSFGPSPDVPYVCYLVSLFCFRYPVLIFSFLSKHYNQRNQASSLLIHCSHINLPMFCSPRLIASVTLNEDPSRAGLPLYYESYHLIIGL